MKLGYPTKPPGIANVAIGRTTRNAAGDQTISGVGFKPKIVIFMAWASGGTYYMFSLGSDDGITHIVTYMPGNAQGMVDDSAKSIVAYQDATRLIRGYISSMNNDGFVITWDITGTIEVTFTYVAIR